MNASRPPSRASSKFATHPIKVISEKEFTIASVAGELNFRDDEAFTDKVLRLKEAVVLFDSVGGNLVAGIEIGKIRYLPTLLLDAWKGPEA